MFKAKLMLTSAVVVAAAGIGAAGIALAQSNTFHVKPAPALCANLDTGNVYVYGFGKCPAFPASVLVTVPIPEPSSTPSSSPSASATEGGAPTPTATTTADS